MLEVVMAVEDLGHEHVVSALLDRVAEELGIPCRSSSRRLAHAGGSCVVSDCEAYLRSLVRGSQPQPDILIIAKDANSLGGQRCRADLEPLVQKHRGLGLSSDVVYCVPDPHIEKWLLVDSHAFRAAYGVSREVPKHRCDRDFYKQLLGEALHAAGADFIVAETEIARRIVPAMNLIPGRNLDDSLEQFVADLRHAVRRRGKLGSGTR